MKLTVEFMSLFHASIYVIKSRSSYEENDKYLMCSENAT